MISQALIALRELIAPSNTSIGGTVIEVDSGRYLVATRKGARYYPSAGGVLPVEGSRVVVQNGAIVQVVGAKQSVPTHYV